MVRLVSIGVLLGLLAVSSALRMRPSSSWHSRPRHPVAPTMPDECSLLKDSGPCKAYMLRYYFNSTTKRCETFVYGGCAGNRNRFATEKECKKRCCSFRDHYYRDDLPPHHHHHHHHRHHHHHHRHHRWVRLIAGVIAGVVGLVILILVGVIVYKKCVRQRVAGLSPVSTAKSAVHTVVVGGSGEKAALPPNDASSPPPAYVEKVPLS